MDEDDLVLHGAVGKVADPGCGSDHRGASVRTDVGAHAAVEWVGDDHLAAGGECGLVHAAISVKHSVSGCVEAAFPVEHHVIGVAEAKHARLIVAVKVANAFAMIEPPTFALWGSSR